MKVDTKLNQKSLSGAILFFLNSQEVLKNYNLNDPNEVKGLHQQFLKYADGSRHYSNFRRFSFELENFLLFHETKPLPTKPQSYFSFFRAPVMNTIPYKAITLIDVYNVVKGSYYKQQTAHLRTLTGDENRDFKKAHFDYCCFSGTFEKRNTTGLINASGWLCVDLDHIKNLSEVREKVIQDTTLEPALVFISPNGDGLKIVVPYLLKEYPIFIDFFKAVQSYFRLTYSIEIDPACKNIDRACFLPHDPTVYINPEILPE